MPDLIIEHGKCPSPLETLGTSALSSEILAKAGKIRLLSLDVDGVLTDGKLFFDAAGVEYKAFHARDGHGLKLLQQSGVKVAVISGRKSASVALRMESLGIDLVYQGYEDKLTALHDLVQRLALTPEQIAHVGDDVLDLPLMCKVGLAIAVQDAHFVVKQHAHWCTQLPGGNGAVREVSDLIMQAQGTFAAAIGRYLAC
jgi:3-deoxy-D-manno-octulosonate 8-phosphate phosphatase (KDO 8-P phosphatase)